MTTVEALLLAQARRIATLDEQLANAHERLIVRGEACARCFKLQPLDRGAERFVYCWYCEYQHAYSGCVTRVAPGYCGACADEVLIEARRGRFLCVRHRDAKERV